tara:strand:+ start:152 stop:1198 length:1047 start_codon:yes stop_codon:yes gene_type:complete
MKKKIFITDQKISLPVSEEKYLLPFLTLTTKGTKYYDTPKNIKITKNYFAEKLLQFHQFIDIFNSVGINLKNKNFLDVGTGNGIIPKSLLLTNQVDGAVGTDMYSPFEHGSAKIPDEGNFKKFIKYLKNATKKNQLSYQLYSRDIKETAEKNIFRPEDISIEKFNLKKLKSYKFLKVGAQKLKKINKKFDIIYCKGFEHIHNWKLVLENFNSISRKNSYVYLKMRPFCSYLGPHRFATTAIPWGHALLTEKEYKRYVYKFHYERRKKMLNDYFQTLSFPRYSIDELIRFFEKKNFILLCQKTETPPYIEKIIKFKNEIKQFDFLLKKNNKASHLDLATSVQHLIFKKI